MDHDIAAMKLGWNRRARRDAHFYIETERSDRDPESFFALGEERAKLLIDPVVNGTLSVNRDGVALDIGCGVGRFTRALGRRFARVVGVDVSGEMVARARAANAAFSNLAFAEGDGVGLPAADRSVDFVWSYEVFQHMPSRQVIESNLRDIVRVLVPSGGGLLHFRTRPERRRPIEVAKGFLPGWVFGIAHRLLGRDALMADKAWRGAAAMSEADIHEACRRAGLTVLATLADPTHEANTRLFAIVQLARP